MVWSAYLGLPMSLAGVGKVLGLEKQKLESGKRLVKYFCKGSNPFRRFAPPSPEGDGLYEKWKEFVNAMGDSQGLGHYGLLRSLDYARDDTMNAADNSCTGARLRNLDSDKWREFVEYNRRDVETEREIRQRLSRYPVPESVWAEYETDQAINDRGIRADRAFVCAALEMDRESREQLTAELARRTEILRPNSVPQIREWLNAHGQECEGLSKAEVRDMMKDAEPEVREVLLLRQQLARTSVRKYAAMANAVCADGRIRGMFQFYGASRSGRWAGRNVQLQNLPQNHLKDLYGVRKLVLKKDHDAVRMLHGSVPDVLSELIRTAFVPEDGKKFIVCDFAAIEARVIAWLAGENWRQEVFRDGGDIYCASASAMFRVPVEKHGVNGHLRQKGKIAELALGYGGSTGALRAMGATEMGIQEEELQPLVDAWRNSNPNIVQLWRNVDLAVKTAVGEKRTVRLNNLTFEGRAGMLLIRLPSGRKLAYVQPRIVWNRFGGKSVCYMGTGTARRWESIESYGPKFVENIVQGIARDLLAAAMQRMDGNSRYAIVAHIHDEVIVEAEQDVTVEEIAEKMSECPAWAEGLVLRADGYECEFYRKE